MAGSDSFNSSMQIAQIVWVALRLHIIVSNVTCAVYAATADTTVVTIVSPCITEH